MNVDVTGVPIPDWGCEIPSKLSRGEFIVPSKSMSRKRWSVLSVMHAIYPCRSPQLLQKLNTPIRSLTIAFFGMKQLVGHIDFTERPTFPSEVTFNCTNAPFIRGKL